MVDRIKDAVNRALAAKGWTQVDSGGDVCVMAIEITQNQQTLNTFYDGFGGGRRWGGFGGFGDATTTTEPTKSVLSSSICSMPKVRIYSGEARRATHFPTMLIRTRRISTREYRRCSHTSLRKRKSKRRISAADRRIWCSQRTRGRTPSIWHESIPSANESKSVNSID